LKCKAQQIYYVRAHADKKLHQRVTVRNMFTIYYISKARNDPLPFPSYRIELFPNLRYVLGARSVDLLYKQARTILSSTVMNRIA